ncbi:MAG TPA: cytochrome P450 [Streptosporangiaceae bacterium]|nr:cytochrome P450 [Streptosporangiaceae bacterium]
MTTVSDPVLALTEPAALRDPGPVYAWLLEHRPVFWHESLETLLVSRHEDGSAVLRDRERFASDFRRAGEELPPAAISVQTLDPPGHTAIRHLLVDALRRLNYRAREEAITRAVRDRLATLAGRPSFDFVSEFAEPLAFSTILGVLGVTGSNEPDLAWFRPVADAIVDGMDAGLWPHLAGPAMSARAELSALTENWLMKPPGDGVVAFAAAHAASRGVSRTVLDNTLRVLLHAGYTSASKILSLGVAALLSRPARLNELAAGDPVPAVEELVRYESPVRALTRLCVAGTVVGGHVVRAGDAVTVLVGAANRDPARFADPGELRLGRSPNPHLGFGRGVHSCLGASLAALQARVVFTTLARHYPHAQLTAAPVFRRNLTLRGVQAVHVALRSPGAPR